MEDTEGKGLIIPILQEKLTEQFIELLGEGKTPEQARDLMFLTVRAIAVTDDSRDELAGTFGVRQAEIDFIQALYQQFSKKD